MGVKPKIRLWHLFYITTVAALLLGLLRLGIDTSARIVIAGSFGVAITGGTLLAVLHRPDRGVLRGTWLGVIATGSIAMVCVGWMFLLAALAASDKRIAIAQAFGVFCFACVCYGGLLGGATTIARRCVRRRAIQARRASECVR